MTRTCPFLSVCCTGHGEGLDSHGMAGAITPGMARTTKMDRRTPEELCTVLFMSWRRQESNVGQAKHHSDPSGFIASRYSQNRVKLDDFASMWFAAEATKDLLWRRISWGQEGWRWPLHGVGFPQRLSPMGWGG